MGETGEGTELPCSILGRDYVRLQRASETFKEVILKVSEVVIYHVLSFP